MELTELEAVVYIMDSFERWLICVDDIDTYATDEEIAAQKQVEKAFVALGIVWPALWW
jgi:hypothetical protein